MVSGKKSKPLITDSQQTEHTLLSSHGDDNLLNSSYTLTDSNNTSLEDLPSTRDKWGRSSEFVFAVAGCAIGLGNVWRFPYLCYKYGGGSFVFAYVFFLFIVGVPMMLLEVTMGQFMSRGAIEVWNMVPISKGIGFASLVIVTYINIYYIVILAWILYYFFQAINSLFTSAPIPWSSCNPAWASECCSSNYAFENNKSVLVKPENCTGKPILPEAEYFSKQVIQITSGIKDTGGMNWELLGYLIMAWVIVFVMVFRGAKSTGKSAYVTATFPLVLLVALVFRGVTLPGAAVGLHYYLVPRLELLMKAETWMAAASQILFSYAICQGSLPAMGSYNKWSFNSMKWTVRLSLVNSCASLLAGVAIFSILGHLSSTMSLPIEEVADKGPGLAFIAYPRALAMLKGSSLWNMLFFFMLLMLGIASQCAEVEGMVTMMVDLKPEFFHPSKPLRRPIFVALSCFACFLLALPMVLKSGMYYFQLMDSYGASGVALMVIAIFEVSSIAWIYGADKYYVGLENMCYTSRKEAQKSGKTDPYKAPWTVFKYLWKFVTPLALLVALCYNFANLAGPSYESVVTGSYEYPPEGVFIAVFLVLSSVLAIPAYMVYKVITNYMHHGTNWGILIEPVYPDDHPMSSDSPTGSIKKQSRLDDDIVHHVHADSKQLMA